MRVAGAACLAAHLLGLGWLAPFVTALVAASLASLRSVPIEQPSIGLDAAIVALSGRVRLREGSQRTSEGIITELWEEVFGRVAGDGEGAADEGKGGAPTGATNSR